MKVARANAGADESATKTASDARLQAAIETLQGRDRSAPRHPRPPARHRSRRGWRSVASSTRWSSTSRPARPTRRSAATAPSSTRCSTSSRGCTCASGTSSAPSARSRCSLIADPNSEYIGDGTLLRADLLLRAGAFDRALQLYESVPDAVRAHAGEGGVVPRLDERRERLLRQARAAAARSARPERRSSPLVALRGRARPRTGRSRSPSSTTSTSARRSSASRTSSSTSSRRSSARQPRPRVPGARGRRRGGARRSSTGCRAPGSTLAHALDERGAGRPLGRRRGPGPAAASRADGGHRGPAGRPGRLRATRAARRSTQWNTLSQQLTRADHGGRLAAGDGQRPTAHAQRRAAAGRRARPRDRAALPGRAQRERARSEALPRRGRPSSGGRSTWGARRSVSVTRATRTTRPPAMQFRDAARPRSAARLGWGRGQRRAALLRAGVTASRARRDSTRADSRGVAAAARGAGRASERAQLQQKIDAERVNIADYQQQLDALDGEARDLVGHVAQRNFGAGARQAAGHRPAGRRGHHRAGVGGARGGARPRAEPAGASARGRSSSSTRS